MGDEADNIVKSFSFVEGDEKEYAKVKERFDQHFIIKRTWSSNKFTLRKSFSRAQRKLAQSQLMTQKIEQDKIDSDDGFS